jgi:TRAP-type C4-dicarboxylate transport system permease small subunit
LPEYRQSRAVGRFLTAIDVAEKIAANSAFVIILVTICWTVISRYVLRSPVSWAEDITSIAFAWLIFIGAAAVHNRRAHISVDLLTSLLPAKLRLLLDTAVEIFVLVFCAYAAWLCGRQTIVAHTTSKTTVLEIPLSLLFVSVTIGFALMALRSAFYVAGFGPEEERKA